MQKRLQLSLPFLLVIAASTKKQFPLSLLQVHTYG